MALFSRRKKSADDVVADHTETEESVVDAPEVAETPSEAAEVTPTIGISVQAFRGVGAQAGPEVELPDPDAAPAASAPTAVPAPAAPAPAPEPERKLPLAPALPPEQTETVAGMKDNVLLRESLKEVEQGATNEQLLGVLRQALQGHMYIRVNGDARAQISEGKPLAVAVVRDGERQFMLAFSSAAAVRDSVQLEKDPTATSAVAQPVTSVLQQVVSGDFAGLIVDNASAPHRVVFPTELLQKALEQADVDMTVKSLIAAPREQDSASKVGEALATKRMWVAVNEGNPGGQVGIAEAQTPDGKRFLQLFSHPLEVLALGRGDRPLPFEPLQLAKILSSHVDMAGVIIDPAGPSIVVEREALTSVLILAIDIDD
ncbi:MULTISPECIES: SseB family protein [unclassified Microbacterium]|uniref:SseB family protein n=1 Tax=unclassified Microbacterium TaxID=2609290 RepID=UPI0034658882